MHGVAYSRPEFGSLPTGDERLHEPRWFACYTRGRHEKLVTQRLQQHSLDCYCPLIPLQRQWHDRRKIVEWPLFPSYVFVRCPPAGLSRVVSTPGVVGVVSSNGAAVSIDGGEIDNVRRFVAALGRGEGRAEPVAGFEKGTRVRILSGPFMGIEGVIVEKRGRDRVLVGLEAIAQSWEVEVPAASTQPISAAAPPRPAVSPPSI